MIRPAILADVEAILKIALEETKGYEMLRADPKSMRTHIYKAISSAKHFCTVSMNDGKVDGVLIGLVTSNLWAQRSNCFIALWKANVPGEGRKLMLAFKEWVQERRAIRVCGLVPDSNHIDPRAYKLAERLGFQRCGGAYLIYN